jgi:hypothetical protein
MVNTTKLRITQAAGPNTTGSTKWIGTRATASIDTAAKDACGNRRRGA